MKKVGRILTSCIVGLSAMVLSGMPCSAYEGRAESRDGRLIVAYKVEDGYKITVRIDTRKKQAAYERSLQTDVSGIKVDFVDVNSDGFQDVIIKYSDESGYSPAVLINRNDLSFINALRDIKVPLYVNTEVEIKEGGIAARSVDYRLKDLNGDGVPEMIFYKVFIKEKGYRHVVLKYNSRTMSYQLSEKGELFHVIEAAP